MSCFRRLFRSMVPEFLMFPQPISSGTYLNQILEQHSESYIYVCMYVSCQTKFDVFFGKGLEPAKGTPPSTPMDFDNPVLRAPSFDFDNFWTKMEFMNRFR